MRGRSATAGCVFALCAACSSDPESAPPAADAGVPEASVDATTDATSDAAPADARPDVDFGAPSDTYPAFHPPVPQVVTLGGPVMQSVRVVPVFWKSDAIATQLTDFLTKWTASKYWSAALSEYGVGTATTATAVTVNAADPVNLTGAQIESWLASNLDGTHPEWGPVDKNTLATTVFALDFPTATSVQGMCGGRGYHGAVAIASGGYAIYTVVPRCKPTADDVTWVMTHEIAEAATDPLPLQDFAYNHVDEADHGWEWAYYGGENGDMCQLWWGNYWRPSDLGYLIQRTWSNVSASAYHDPCAPVPSDLGPYFNSAIVLPETTDFFDENWHWKARSVNVSVGQSRTVDVDLFSDAKTSGPWTIKASDELAARGGEAVLDLALDRSTGQNGEKVHLTIGVKGHTSLGLSVVLLTSTLGTRDQHWIGVVGIPK